MQFLIKPSAPKSNSIIPCSVCASEWPGACNPSLDGKITCFTALVWLIPKSIWTVWWGTKYELFFKALWIPCGWYQSFDHPEYSQGGRPPHCPWLWKTVFRAQLLEWPLWSHRPRLRWYPLCRGRRSRLWDAKLCPAGPPPARWSPAKPTVAGSVPTLPRPRRQPWKTCPAVPGERRPGLPRCGLNL